MAPRGPPVTRRPMPAEGVTRRPMPAEGGSVSEIVREEMRVRVLHAIGEGIHGPYDPRVMGAVDRLIDTIHRAAGASGDADARSRSPRRDHSTTHHGHPRTRQWVPRVIVQTNAVGETHTTIYYCDATGRNSTAPFCTHREGYTQV